MGNVLPHKDIDYPILPTKDPGLTRGRNSKAFTDDGIWLGADKHLYAEVQVHREDEWRRTVLAYECRPDDFYNAYQYLNLHPIFYRFGVWKVDEKTAHKVADHHERHLINDQGLDQVHLIVVRVDPRTNRISDDPALNTATRIWFETGPVEWTSPTGTPCLDTRLMGGAKTYEKAIIRLARRVHRIFGNDRKVIEAEQAAYQKTVEKRAAKAAKQAKEKK